MPLRHARSETRGRPPCGRRGRIGKLDRALPRLVVAVSLIEEFGYSQLELTERKIGAGLIIEAGMNTPRR